MKEDVPRKQKPKFKTTGAKTSDNSWVIKTIIITFTMSAFFTVLSSGVMEMVSIWVAILILFLIILTGIIFDVIGMAVTTAAEAPFHSMAAHRIKGSARAIKLIKSKDKVSNFCNDVVGDICGIISGSASATVVAYIIKNTPTLNGFLMSIAITSFVAALTVGGKAIGKGFAIRYSNSIVYTVARFLSFLSLRSK